MITKLTNVNLIKGNLQENNKNEVFAELAQMLFENNRISSKEAFLTDIEAREALSITSMDALHYPHAQSKTVTHPALAAG
uniref:PTS sugar transporter subunit IIA n=1 Tax=Vibrio vulnificus TaxID=672 RepID=UPI0005037C0F